MHHPEEETLPPLQNRLPERAPHNTTPRPNRLRNPQLPRHDLGVHLHQVHRHQATRVVQRLANVVALAEREPPAHGRAGRGRPHGVQGVDVEGEVDGGVGADVFRCHLDDAADAVPGSVSLVSCPGLCASCFWCR